VKQDKAPHSSETPRTMPESCSCEIKFDADIEYTSVHFFVKFITGQMVFLLFIFKFTVIAPQWQNKIHKNVQKCLKMSNKSQIKVIENVRVTG